MASYRQLIVWQRAMQLVPAVYAIARLLPPEERYGLADRRRQPAIETANGQRITANG
jgi:hypothetical protein